MAERPSPMEMLDAICAAVQRACVEGGETRVHVVLSREIPRADGTVEVEFAVVEGFKCAHPDVCGQPVHVWVSGMTTRFEWPEAAARPDGMIEH